MTALRFPSRSRAGGGRRESVLPFWLRPARGPRPVTVAPTPSEPRWWAGVALLTASVLLLCFVAHVALFGALQESRSQTALYAQLRSELAQGIAPLGPTDVHDDLVPAGAPVALITIPSLGVSQVIVQGSGPDELRAGPGHRRDTVMPGQVGTSVVLGRQTTYGAPFRDLGSLKPGARIQVVTGQGRSTFTVLGLRRPGDRMPIAPKATESRLQLVSAIGPALAPDSVLYVDAVRTKAGLDAASPVIATAALNPGEGVMQTAPGTWLPFVFSLQWLAIASGLALYLFRRWGRWQTWILALPVLLVLGAATADAAIAFLPNLV